MEGQNKKRNAPINDPENAHRNAYKNAYENAYEISKTAILQVFKDQKTQKIALKVLNLT